MSSFDALASLPLTVERADLQRHESPTTSGFRRVTTEVRLHGPEHVGRGEDVTYEASHHDALAETGPPPLSGEYDLEDCTAVLSDLDLFPGDEPERESFRHYRRWAFEAAALDLALRQAGETLASALGDAESPLEREPVRFLASTRLGDPPRIDRVEELLAADPELQFKLDATPEWDDDLIAALGNTGAVRTVDLKGHYQGTDVDVPAEPAFYRRILEGFSDAIVEDPAVTPETRPVLDGEWDRIAWDAPVHDVADLADLPATGWLNVKPSRFGSVESLLDAFEHCEREGIDVYLGGQFELGPGRGQLHDLASVFCADAPNDVAPHAYNDPEYDPAEDGPRPRSPLSVPEDLRGFGWA